MTGSDDALGDMDNGDTNDTELNDDQIERLIAGTDTPEGLNEVAATFAAMREVGAHQPGVAATAALREFVSTPPSATKVEHELPQPLPVAMSETPTRRHGMLTGLVATTSAKLALAGGVALAGVTGAHALGIVDVPLLPAESEPVQLVSAGDISVVPTDPGNSDDQDPAQPPGVADDGGDPADGITEQSAPEEPAASVDVAAGDNRLTITSGDISLSVSVEVIDGEPKISVDIEGVSAQCEAAVEALEDLSDLATVGAAGDDIEAACGDELSGLDFDLGNFPIDPGTLFGGGGLGDLLGGCLDTTDPQAGEASNEDVTSCVQAFELGDFEGMEDLLKDFGLEDFNLEDFDFSQLDEILKDLGLEDFNLEDFNLEDFGLEDFNLEDFDLSQLDEILEDLDLDQLGQLLEDFGTEGG